MVEREIHQSVFQQAWISVLCHLPHGKFCGLLLHHLSKQIRWQPGIFVPFCCEALQRQYSVNVKGYFCSFLPCRKSNLQPSKVINVPAELNHYCGILKNGLLVQEKINAVCFFPFFIFRGWKDYFDPESHSSSQILRRSH